MGELPGRTNPFQLRSAGRRRPRWPADWEDLPPVGLNGAMDPEVAERLARRYPARRAGLLDWRLLAIVCAALALAWVGWVAMDGSTPPVAARVDAFNVVSDTEIEVIVTLEREDPAKAAECLLFVQAVSYERVGELQVTVPAGGPRVTTQELQVRTFKRGTSAALEGCRAAG